MKTKNLYSHCLFTFHIVAALYLAASSATAQDHIYRYPDVSAEHIVFSFANDLWLVSKTGGQAYRLSSPEGPETYPRFSPDGHQIAFSANYDGNTDIYTINIHGGNPQRLTHHGMSDRVVEWYPSGDSLLFASSRYSGKQRYNQFFRVSAEGSLPIPLALEHAEFGSFSPEGKNLAFTYKSRITRTWKRYRGGMAADIFIFDRNNYTSENITRSDHNDELPMWHENTIYYLSDRGQHKRANIWAYDTDTKKHKQITEFRDYDIHLPALGPDDIVFEAGGSIYLLDLHTRRYNKVDITIVDDFINTRPQLKNVSALLQNVSPSPDGNRVLVEARGDIFNLPAEKGAVRNMTSSSGSAERYPAWSPDGSKWAYWSDQSGEYQLMIADHQGIETTSLTHFKTGFKYQPFWSPDSKKLAWIGQNMVLHWIDTETNQIHRIDQGLYLFQGALDNFKISWSGDSRYLVYDRGLTNRQNAIFIYDTKKQKKHQVTSGFYNCTQPAFSTDNKFLVLQTNQRFSPQYSSFDNSWVYVNSSQIALIPLDKEERSPFLAENDSVTINTSTTKEKKKDSIDQDTTKDQLRIDFEGMESRMIILPLEPGNISHPYLTDNKVYYLRRPVKGEIDGKTRLQYFDLKDKKEETVISGISFYQFTADHQKILTGTRGKMGFIAPGKGKKLEKIVPLDQIQTWVDPKEEWKQIFNDVWRIERDYFYDQNLHGVDWDEMKAKYGNLVEHAHSRTDLNYLIGELIGELNASHTYRSGGDTEESKNTPVGYLGINWSMDQGAYKIAKIIRPATWDTEVRSPLDAPGIGVKEGQYILEVNGLELAQFKNPYAAFEGLAGKTVALVISDDASGTHRNTVYVNTMASETRLRNLAWIEQNRKYVDKASDGQIGYVYVPSTGLDGQKELVRMFYGQINKKALVIDERFNNGGQIPDRFIELLNRPALAYWDVRDGATWSWPPTAHFGPKAMLINGWSGSGGDAFPDYFRKAGIGPLIGTKTWGGLIGITGTPTLVDGGSVTAPTFRMYNPDQTWFPEGHGVEPDIYIPEDPSALARGNDPQLKAAVGYLLKAIADSPPAVPEPPAVEERN